MDVNLIETFIVVPVYSIIFIMAVYWFWKANKLLGGKIKSFVIWIIIGMFSFSSYSIVNLFQNVLRILIGEFWHFLRIGLGGFTLLSFAMSAYYIKNIFKIK